METKNMKKRLKVVTIDDHRHYVVDADKTFADEGDVLRCDHTVHYSASSRKEAEAYIAEHGGEG